MASSSFRSQRFKLGIIKMASASQTASVGATHRKVLLQSVSMLCKEQGFHSASKLALETLTEMLQSYLTEIAECSREFCEQCHRTYPDVTDVKMALADLGIRTDSLDNYAQRIGRESAKTPGKAKPPSTPKPLQSSLTKQSRPSYVPVHLPPFPDVHAYIRTPTLRKPVNEYKVVREKFASQKREVELSLTGFMARTRSSETKLFETIDENKYPMVASERSRASYIRALVPEEDFSELDGMTTDGKRNEEDEDLKDKQESLKDVQENPYVKSPKKAKIR